VCIIEAFEARGLAAQIKDANSDYVQLSDLVARLLAEQSITLSRSTRRFLPDLRDLGHRAAHGRYFTARREDVEKISNACRVVLEELLHHARLI
jgi:hypothetical protein